MPTAINVIYEQGPCIAVNKPGGVLTQAVPGVDSLEVRLKDFLRQREGKVGANIYLGVPHRLDRPVSGAIVFARHIRATRRLAEQFEGRMVRKVYWALVEGVLAEDQGVWRDYMRKVPDEPRAELVEREHSGARLAVLKFRVLQRFESATWLQIELDTGRMHQIRLQTASRGWPILGDWQYASTRAFGPQYEDRRERWVALHARFLGFRHPMTRKEVRITAPIPEFWSEYGFQEGTLPSLLDNSSLGGES